MQDFVHQQYSLLQPETIPMTQVAYTNKEARIPSLTTSGSPHAAKTINPKLTILVCYDALPGDANPEFKGSRFGFRRVVRLLKIRI